MLATPRNSALYSRFWRWLFRGIAAVFPVLVLLLVQINALRYQSELILWVQRAWLALDLLALVWFFRRNPLDGSAWPKLRPARIRRWAGLLWAPVFIVAVNRLYLSTVPADADAMLVRYDPGLGNRLVNPVGWLTYAGGNPLDLLLCPWLNWGCRFLRVDHRLLVDKVRDEKALGVLRMNISERAKAATAPEDNSEQKAEAERAKAMAAIEGVFLRRRSLRFAVIAESRLYAADLIGASLSRAYLRDANLSNANLRDANLSGASLFRADLSDANLSDARNLTQPQLDEACGTDAKLPPELSDKNLKPCSSD